MVGPLSGIVQNSCEQVESILYIFGKILPLKYFQFPYIFVALLERKTYFLKLYFSNFICQWNRTKVWNSQWLISKIEMI